MNNRATIFTAAVVSGLLLPLLAPKTAGAQEWLRDRRLQEGAGIRTGDFELHPGIAGEMGYDSNWFLRSNKSGPNITNGEPQAPILGAGILRITPSLSLSTLGALRREDALDIEPPKVQFRAGLAATYREFFGDEAIRKQRNVSIGADARLDILPQRTIGAALMANYVRTIQPNVVSTNPDFSFNRDDIGVGGELVTQPNGGTLDWHLGYQFHDTIFEDETGTQFNNYTHEAFTKGRWKFRPRTALIYDGTLRFTQYSNQTAEPGGLHNSTPVRARIGLNGLVTSRLALLAMGGWGASFFDSRGNAAINQYDSFIGQAELKWFLTGTPGNDTAGGMSLLLSSIAVGYVRDFQNSYLGDYYGTDRGYLNMSYFFAGRALITATGGVGAIEYPTLFFPDGTQRNQSFTDLRVDGTLFGEYRFADSLGLNATIRYSANFSDTQVALTPARDQVFDMNWRRFEAFLGVRWFL